MKTFLETLGVGRTAVVMGLAVVTRWGQDAYEIGTFGRNVISKAEALARLEKLAR